MSDKPTLFRYRVYDTIGRDGVSAWMDTGTAAEHDGRPMVQVGSFLMPRDDSWSETRQEALDKAAATVELYAARLSAQAISLRSGVIP